MASQDGEPKFGFDSSATLLAAAAENGLSIADLMLENERCWRDTDEVSQRIDDIWSAMQDCVERGLRTDGVLPGKMSVLRRAPKMRRTLEEQGEPGPMDALDWVNAFAIAVNEENAAGGRVPRRAERFRIIGRSRGTPLAALLCRPRHAVAGRGAP